MLARDNNYGDLVISPLSYWGDVKNKTKNGGRGAPEGGMKNWGGKGQRGRGGEGAEGLKNMDYECRYETSHCKDNYSYFMNT